MLLCDKLKVDSPWSVLTLIEAKDISEVLYENDRVELILILYLCKGKQLLPAV